MEGFKSTMADIYGLQDVPILSGCIKKKIIQNVPIF